MRNGQFLRENINDVIMISFLWNIGQIMIHEEWTAIKIVLAPKSSTNLCQISYGKLHNSPTVQHFQHFQGDLWRFWACADVAWL